MVMCTSVVFSHAIKTGRFFRYFFNNPDKKFEIYKCGAEECLDTYECGSIDMISDSVTETLSNFCFPIDWCFEQIEQEEPEVKYEFYCEVSTND